MSNGRRLLTSIWRSIRHTQFSVRVILMVQLALALTLTLWTWTGSSVIYALFLSTCCGVVRRFLAFCRARRLRPPCVGTTDCHSPRLNSTGCAERNRMGPALDLWTFLQRPIDASWIWVIWLSYQLTWVVWRADAPIEKDACFLAAVIPVWVICGLALCRHHHYALGRRVAAGRQALGVAVGLAMCECFLLFTLATLLGAHVHLWAGGRW